MCQAKIDGHSRSRVDHPQLAGVPRCLKPDNARCPITHSCASLKPARQPAGRAWSLPHRAREKVVRPARARYANCFDIYW
jgi:hypothetical protein